MAIPEMISVSLQSAEHAPTVASVQLSTWTKARAATKAWKVAGIVLGAAALMLPIPIVHFFAIPVVLIGAPVVWYGVFKLHLGGIDLVGTGVCPQCQASVPLKGAADRWPLTKICPSCRSTIVVTKS